MMKLNLKLNFILIIILFMLSGCTGKDMGFGPPEREIRKYYDNADKTYNKLVNRKSSSSGKWENAIRQFQFIAQKFPKSSFADDSLYKVGMCYIHAGKNIENSSLRAILTFDEMIKKYPETDLEDKVYYWKAYAYIIKGHEALAVKEFKAFLTNYPDSELYSKAETWVNKHSPKDGAPEISEASASESQSRVPPISIKKAEKLPVSENKTPTKPFQPVEDNQSISHKPDEILTDNIEKSIAEESISKKLQACIKGIRYNSSPGFTRVVLDLNESPEYKHGILRNPQRVYVNLKNTTLECDNAPISINDMIVQSIRSSQFDADTTRVVLDIQQMGRYEVFTLENPSRLVIDVYKAEKALEDSSTRDDESIPLVKQLGLKVKTIVLDPGHGGKHPGAVSKSGTLEKNLVLDITQRTKAMLESDDDYKVYMTRNADTHVPLSKRTDFANNMDADIFISIHINAATNGEARGIETYYLSMASDEEAAATAALENASSDLTINDINDLIQDIINGVKVEESRELARTIQSHLCYHTNAEDRGVKRAPFVVLIGANAPSVLVELGFISNKRDEQLLLNSSYKSKLAKALSEAVKAYINSLENTD